MFTKSPFSLFVVLCSFISMPIIAFAAAPRPLTPEEFLQKGAGIFVGQIVDVQVLGQELNYEYGNVVIQVVEVLVGKVDIPFLNLSYRKQQGPDIINGYAWDLVPPKRGEKVIVYFGKKDGTYYVSSAGSNAIDEIDSFVDPKIEALRKIVSRRPQ